MRIGHFETDNRSDEHLGKIVLEGNGGGGNHESYELAFYFGARKTATDAWEKRGKKGYFFSSPFSHRSSINRPDITFDAYSASAN